MEIRAYYEEYVAGAQRILGDMMDFAIVSLNLDTKDFETAFLISPTSKQFAAGNPKYVAGMNGCELARQILTETETPFTDMEDAMYLDKGPEYWAGWALAFFQWYSDYSFQEILRAVPLENVIRMYSIYHEMDIMQFVDRMYEIIREKNEKTTLRSKRENCGYSQNDLAMASGVSLRQIQLFEHRQRDINKTSAETLLRLSKALFCKMEDVIEK